MSIYDTFSSLNFLILQNTLLLLRIFGLIFISVIGIGDRYQKSWSEHPLTKITAHAEMEFSAFIHSELSHSETRKTLDHKLITWAKCALCYETCRANRLYTYSIKSFWQECWIAMRTCHLFKNLGRPWKDPEVSIQSLG